jgi:hypothetical protein
VGVVAGSGDQISRVRHIYHKLLDGELFILFHYESFRITIRAPMTEISPRCCFAAALAIGLVSPGVLELRAQQKPDAPAAANCRVEPVNYKGWQAQQVSNALIKLIFVPQNGGRLMQVIFDGHPYLFVNERYAGKYLPPPSTQWLNYGGDKLWVLPEGNEDERHWAGNSDVLDDGPFEFQTRSQGQRCEVVLSGPADPQTGLQFTRTVSLDADSTNIKFHAVVKNASGHPIEWSVQSVSQYDTGDAGDRAHHNKNIWGFTKTNPASSYLNQYHVRFGPAENTAAQVRSNGLFAVHYMPLAAELWVDSKDGWLAVVDGETRYAMVERFHYDETKPYPGKASVIFWTNGAELHQHPDGTTTFGDSNEGPPAIYMEAEVNSPMERLEPGEEFNFDTAWFPTRADAQFEGVTDAGVVLSPLRATQGAGEVTLSGSFGVFFSGKLVAHLYDDHGVATGTRALDAVDPRNPVILQAKLSAAGRTSRVSIHVVDHSGVDRGALGEVAVESRDKNE